MSEVLSNYLTVLLVSIVKPCRSEWAFARHTELFNCVQQLQLGQSRRLDLD